MKRCINCGLRYDDDNDPCYGNEDATPEWPVFHTPEDGEPDQEVEA